MDNKILNTFKLFLGWPITIISLLFIFKIIADKSVEIIPLIHNINFINLLLGLFFLITFFFLRGNLWHLLINDETRIETKESLNLWALAELKRYTPGNIWSFLGRTFSFEKKGLTKKKTALYLIYEAEFFIIGCFIVSLFSLNYTFNLLAISLSQITIYLIYISFLLFLILFIFNEKITNYFKNQKIKTFLKIFPNLNYLKNARLILLSTIALSFFGIGSYFSAISLFNLDIRNFLLDSSFLSFSLLIGYLSIITPMGLGIRELIVVFGFSKIIGMENAGILAIIIRLVLILSELIFVYLVIRINSIKQNIISRLYFYINKKYHEFLLLIGILFYFIYFTISSFLRFDNFYTGKFDLGNMAQTVWNTLNGNFFMLTNPNGTEIVSRLSFHADFILILLTPFYYFWPNPKILLLIQTLVISLGAIYVYLIAKQILKSKNIALLFSFVYLINPLIQYVNLYDFHAVSFAITFLLASFYYILKNNFYLTFLFLILAGLTKEQIWLVSALMFLYFYIKNHKTQDIRVKKALSFVFSVLSFIIFYYLIWIAIPNASGSNHFALSYYSEFGDSPGIVIKNILLDPLKTLGVVFDEKNIKYLYNLFMPVGFLSIFSPLYLIFALPDLIINLLSNNRQLSDIYYQYTSGIIPFLFVSSIYGFKYILKIVNKNVLIIYLLITSLLSVYFIGPLPFSKNPNTDMFIKQVKNREEISKFLDTIPNDIKVAATNNLGAYLSNRKHLFVIPVGTKSADMVMFLLNDSYAQPSLNVQKEMANNFEKNIDYKLIIKNDDFVAFKRINIDK